MSTIQKLSMVAALCVVSFLSGKFLGPARVEIKEVEKIVYKENQEIKKNYSKKEVILPDGTKTIETTINSDKHSEVNSETSKEKDTITTNRPDWHLSVGYELNADKVQSYSLSIQKRIFSELYIGVSANTQQTFGVSIGLGF